MAKYYMMNSNNNILLVKSLSSDWALLTLLCAQCMINSSIRVDSNELVRQLTIAYFANALVSDYQVGLLQLVCFFFLVQCLHV